jgi:hypothetical protein
MDSFRAHVSERSLRLLSKNRIMTLVFRVHIINLSQVLDLVLFDPMKNTKDSLANQPEFASVPGQMWKIMHLYEQTATWFTIRPCFRKAGLSPSAQTQPFQFQFNEEVPGQSAGFRELWERSILVVGLSRRQRV